MTRILLLILTFGLVVCKGQNAQDIYEIKIGKYSFKTVDRPYIETKASFSVTINFPIRIDPVTEFDADGHEHKTFDTTDHFSMTKIMDSLSAKDILALINSEIEVYNNGKKLKVDRIGVNIYSPDGWCYNTNYESNKISSDKEVLKHIKKSPVNTYIILDTIWFYPTNGERNAFSDRLGWKIIAKD